MTERTTKWRRYPARSGAVEQRQRPPLVEARVQFAPGVALVEIINRQAEVIEVRVRGIEPKGQTLNLSGNMRASFPFQVGPGAEVTIHLEGAPEPILYQGTAPGGAALNQPGSPDEPEQRTPLALPSSEPWDGGERADCGPGPGANSDT